MENANGSSLESVSVAGLIKELGLAGCYLILGYRMGSELINNFSFEDWKNILIEAKIRKDENVKEQALEKLALLAESFEELMIVHLIVPNENVSKKCYEEALKKGASEDWLKIYRQQSGLFLSLFAHEERKVNLIKKAREIIFQIAEA